MCVCVCALSYLKGLYSFGLLETRLYDQAEKVAMEVRFFSSPLQSAVHAVVINVTGWSRLSVPALVVSVQFGK